ncbi:hypothetical protein [Streptomyces gardneri]|uniref:hypothetical protein n=1 Tax=Streptomyces gardneri TaxID=66892 RepID=UPI0035E1D99D
MSTITLFVLLLLIITGLLATAGVGYLVWRHPRLGIPLTVAVAFAALFVTAVIGLATLKI